MTALKVLSLHQPWATFVMLGVKRFETRPGPPAGNMRPDGIRPGIGGCAINRGDIIGIASTQNPEGITAEGLTEGGWAYNYFGADGEYQACWCFRSSDEGRRGQTMLTGPDIDIGDEGSIMPLGCLLGTVRVVDAYPMIDPEFGWQYDLDTPEIAVLTDIDELHVAGPFDRTRDISSELPYGDWRSGRWAIELAEPTLTTDSCPWPACSHGSVPAADPDRPDMRGVRSDEYPDGEPLDPCPICDADEVCFPIPVTGRQGVWSWAGEVRAT